MSPNDERLQELHHLLVEQMKTRPEKVVANLNALLQDTNLELKLFRANITSELEKEWEDNTPLFPLFTGERCSAPCNASF